MMSSARNLYLELEDVDTEELDTSSGCDMSFENENMAPMSPPPSSQPHAPRKLFFNSDEVRSLYLNKKRKLSEY